ncbi:MAG: phosphoglycerate mutase family protein [Ilumatobacteraceae bacterium]
MSVFVVRHAKAGSRRDWDRDDELRPLTKSGRLQADDIAERLRSEHVTGLWSSPYVRCVQTLVPLGRALHLDVVSEPRLAEGASVEDTMALLRNVGDGAVLCSHGDVIPDLLQALTRRGTRILTPPDWRKASIWVLDPPDADGVVATASVEPPAG